MSSLGCAILLWTGLFGQAPAAGDALPFEIVLEENQVLTRTVRFANQCSGEHRFQASSTNPAILRTPGLSGPITLASGGRLDLDFEVSTARLEGRQGEARLVIRCLTCEREPGCGQGDLALAVKVSLPARTAPWNYRPSAAPSRPCAMTLVEGRNLAELFLSRADQLSCAPAGSEARRIVAPSAPEYPFFRALDESWSFSGPDGERALGQLDGLPSFSPVERALLGYLGTQRLPPAGSTLSRAFSVQVLLRLVDWNRSRRAESSWVPSTGWVSQVLAAVPRILEGESGAHAPQLPAAELGRLEELVQDLARELGLDRPNPGAPYLAGIERVSLAGGFRRDDLVRTPGPPGVLLSFSRFQRDALYGDFGYYTTGHASIGRTGHFETVPQKAFPVFGGLIGEVAHRVFQSLATPAAPSSFAVREDGGGRGELARSLLIYLQTQALLRPEGSYGELWRRLRFQEVEISPDRVSEQSAEIRRLEGSGVLEPGRFEITLADATRFESQPALEGLVLSNELLDVMPVEKFYVQDSGRAWLVCPVPYLEPGQGRFLDEAWGPESDRVKRESRRLAARFRLPEAASRTYLTGARFRQYQAWLRRVETLSTASPADLAARLPRFLEGLLPVDLVPQLEHLVQTRYADLFGGLVYRGESESEAYLETARSEYLATIDRSLGRGAILLIDYMSVSAIPNNAALLTYGESRSEGRWANPYERFGLQDITLPPDGRLLAREAGRLGWRIERLAPQETLLELASAGRDPQVGIGLVAAYARLLALPSLDVRIRAEFETWLLDRAREAVDAAGLLAVLRGELPQAYREALGDDEQARLERVPALLQPGVRWEPENPNFHLLLTRKGEYQLVF